MKSELTRGGGSERDLRVHLAAAYRIFADLQMDDLTYTHLSARLPEEDAYLIYPFGLFFEEVTASSLLKVTLKGDILEGKEDTYNTTAHIIHGSLYRERPDIQAIFHLHTSAGIAVSNLECGLLPLSQFSFHFENQLAYHAYDSLALEEEIQGKSLIRDLGDKKIMMMRNHGTLICGESLPEAFLYAYFLEKACQVQCATLSCGKNFLIPSEEIRKQASYDLRAFEKPFGERDWKALLRKLDRKDPGYKA